MSGQGVLRNVEGGRKAFWCPGCKEMHQLTVGGTGWQWNGSYDKPTFMPSIKVTYGHPKGHTNDNPAPLGFPKRKDRPDLWVEEVCHSYVRDGKIQFLADCTHVLKNQTVELLPMPD